MKYEAKWESLDKRPVPQWFQDAKFGIFIHWGLYSVPSFCSRKDYAEWYAHQIATGYEPSTSFHKKTYGENFKYEDFVKDFKAELFNADEWADLFKRAGAKYVNLVSKHHDGYCLYKSQYAWNWNTVDVGPHKDFCRELKDALDKTDIRFGVYHSVYEWFNPLYLKDPEEYALKHLIPMLKELVEEYKPATLFTDGEWEHESSVWHSEEFLQWLYNESSVKDYIVPNDRWGKETRGRHGGNYTTEYGLIDINGVQTIEDAEEFRYFEECRGIGNSFGFNRMETLEDYMTGEELVTTLVDLVSKGGNFLLNVGPAADGTIPVIMQERLLEIGSWLKVNGEGIYSSRVLKKSNQEKVWYTTKLDADYVFIKQYPFGEIVLEDYDYSPDKKAVLLGNEDLVIKTENANGKTKLIFPVVNPESVVSKYIWTIKIK